MGPTLPGGRKGKPSMTRLRCRGRRHHVSFHISRNSASFNKRTPTSSSQARLNYPNPHKPAKTLLALENKQFFVSQSREGRLGNAEVFRKYVFGRVRQ
jgi:hypothetical protein